MSTDRDPFFSEEWLWAKFIVTGERQIRRYSAQHLPK